MTKGVTVHIMQPIQRLNLELQVAKQMLLGTLELPAESEPNARPSDDKGEPGRREELGSYSLVGRAFDVSGH